MAKIQVGGELTSIESSHKLVDAAQVKDISRSDKTQAAINAEFDTAISGKVDKETGKGLSSVDVTTTMTDAWDAKYDKPTTGIPATDMADAVQASLALADNAVQPEANKGLYPDEDAAKLAQVGAEIGDLSGLSTQIKTNLVAAINEVNGKTVQMDAAMSATSTNGVQNKVIKAYVDAADATTLASSKTYTDNTKTALQNAITAEKTAREAADTLLATNLATEVTAREAAVDALNEAIASGVGTTSAVIQPAMTSTETSVTDGVSAKGIADFVAEQKGQLQAEIDDLDSDYTKTKEAVENIVVFDKDGVVAALDKLEEILRKVVYVDDEEAAIDAYKVLVAAIKSENPEIGAAVYTPSVSIVNGVMTLSCTTTGASIYYTLDGTTPTSASTKYTSPVTLTDSCTIKVVAIKDGESSKVRTTTYSKPSGQYITFADANVKAVLVASSINTDGDDEISVQEAAAAATVPVFTNNATITSFDELEQFGITYLQENAFKNCISLTSVKIPATVKSVGITSFYGCTSLASVDIAEGVELGSNAIGMFNGCTSLTTLTIPNSFGIIPLQFAYNCTSLASVTIPNNVTTINKSAFDGCKNLVIHTLPTSLSKIEERAFFNCIKLDASELPNGVTEIGAYAFYGTKITFASLPEGLTTLGEWCFATCPITLNELPSTITSIPNRCFNGCSQMPMETLHSGITNISTNAFNNCTLMTKVKLMMTTPPTIADTSFRSVTNFYLPDENYDALLALYQAANVWKDMDSSRFHKISEW